MPNNNESSWPWPEELDALKAAPQHHKLLFENELVRVLNTCIPSGEITGVHTHKWLASLYVISWSGFIRYDKDGNVMLDSRTLAKSPSPSTALWTEPLVPHSLKNIGTKDLHMISCEIKNTK